MKKDQIFKATDAQKRTLRYKYLGESEQPNGYNIHLFNLDWNEDTFIETKWFEHRKIELIENKQELINSLSTSDTVLIKYDDECNTLAVVLSIGKDKISFMDENGKFDFTKKYLINSKIDLELIPQF